YGRSRSTPGCRRTSRSQRGPAHLKSPEVGNKPARHSVSRFWGHLKPRSLGPSPSYGTTARRFRTAARLTQEELAERAGLSARGIQALERGLRRSPHPDTTRRLAEALRLGDAERAELLTALDRAGPPGRRARAAASYRKLARIREHPLSEG